MARGVVSRSQRQASGSQSQPAYTQNGRSQTQRNGRSRRVEEEEEEEQDAEDDEDAMDEDEDEEGPGDDDMARKANDLVRLALFTEQKRNVLRRDEISKKVMGSKSRRFAEVFARAQEILRKTFGMELVELQNRVEEPSEKDKDPKDDKKQQKDKAAPGIKKKAPTGTKTYVLRSVLDPQLIQIATYPDADILRIEQADLVADKEHALDEETVFEPTGAILAWERADQLGNVGLLYVILSLILVHGRTLPDNDLRTFLRRLRLTPAADAPFNARSTAQHTSVEHFLGTAIRQGYLDRQRVGDTGKGAKKRGRAAAGTQAANGEEAVFEWRWGARAYAEVGEADVARFVAEFMVERTRGEEEEGVQESPETRKMREGMMKGIERAAGGSLAELA